MKSTKLLLAILTLALFISCSSDDDNFDFSGNWNLSSATFISTPKNGDILKYNLNTTIIPDQNCLSQSNLSIFSNGVAVLKITSILEKTIQIVAGTDDELEQIVTCEPIETIYNLTWVDGRFFYDKANNKVVKSNSNGSKSINFIDQNGSVKFTGIIGDDNTMLVNRFDEDLDSSTTSIEVNGEVIEFFSGNYLMVFSR